MPLSERGSSAVEETLGGLDELPDKLRQSVLLIKDKIPKGATFEDAETLARYAHLEPRTNAYIDFVRGAMT